MGHCHRPGTALPFGRLFQIVYRLAAFAAALVLLVPLVLRPVLLVSQSLLESQGVRAFLGARSCLSGGRRRIVQQSHYSEISEAKPRVPVWTDDRDPAERLIDSLTYKWVSQ